MYERLRRNIARHVTLTDGEFDYFASLLEPRRVEKKQALLTPGDVCCFEGFVEAGCLRVYSNDRNGFDSVLYFAPEDWWVADIHSFVSGAPAVLGIDALENTDVLLIDKCNKERLYACIPKFERLFRIMTQRALVALQQRLIAFMRLPAQERYFDFKRRYPGLEARVPQHQIAAYLGICPEFLSRLRRKHTGPDRSSPPRREIS
jgi:CRP-like cAMP-binding protein